MAKTFPYLNQNTHLQKQPSGSSRLGLRTSVGGEIVEVDGGHIIRSTGGKDRHSKVCTSKGPRDRRVRLSAHTAIQFYDVQDRLGFDRPSKAVDWLIKKAKTAIDKLAELPAWKPTAVTRTTTTTNASSFAKFAQKIRKPDHFNHFEQHPDDSIVDNPMGCSQNSSFLPPSLDSDSIADTIKTFFPMGASSIPANNSSSFPPLDLVTRNSSSRSQDLKLSLQSFSKDPVPHTSTNNNNNDNIYFDGSGWSDSQTNPPGGFQSTGSWGGDSTGFVFNSQPVPTPSPTTPFRQPLFGQTLTSELFNNNSRREPLQSSTTPLFRAWVDPLNPFAIDQQASLAFHYPNSGFGGLSGYEVPARIRGEEEEHDSISDRPSSASSDSRH